LGEEPDGLAVAENHTFGTGVTRDLLALLQLLQVFFDDGCG
jgi:hypothetical protein